MSDIDDILRGMLRKTILSERAKRGAATRAANYAKAHDRKAQRLARARERRQAKREAFKAALDAAFPPLEPAPHFDRDLIGRIRKHEDGTRTAWDRHGRAWNVIVDKRGWTAYGERDTVDGYPRQAIVRASDGSELRAKMRKMPRDLGRFMSFGRGLDLNHS